MLPKRVVFAANATPISGAGHLMRLIGLAKAMPSSIKKIFVGSVTIPWATELTRNTFVSANLIDSRELYDKNNLIIVDSYDYEFCSFVRSNFAHSHIIQIVDRYTHFLPDSQLIVMDLPFAYKSRSVEGRVIAHGIKFLPKRQFSSSLREYSKTAKRVLVTTGGTANESVYSQLIEELTQDLYREIEFNFIGKSKLNLRTNLNFRFHEPGSSFESITSMCDTAVSASGTTMWDLFANQLVVGLTAVADNQLVNFRFATESHQALPVFQPKSQVLIKENLRLLLFDEDVRKRLHSNISGVYDFLGAERVCELIFRVYREGSRLI